MEGLKKTTLSFVVVCLLISVGLIPVVSASMTSIRLNDMSSKNGIEKENHPAFYNVTIIRSYGFSREKIVKQVSYKDAMEIKNEFELINTETDDSYQRTIQKNEILRSYEIFDEFPLLNHLYENSGLSKPYKINSDGMIFSIPFGVVVGEFYGSTFNMFNFLVFGMPLMIESDEGADLECYLLGFIPQYLKTENPVSCFSGIFMGEIGLIPFIDPNGGLIQGISIFGFATELY